MSAKKILLVEDQILVAVNISKRLSRLGYQMVGPADSGEKAIGMALELRPDLIIMDICLNGEMDGIEAVKRIHDHVQIPVIYLAASTDEETLQRAKLTEAFGYLVKPFDETALRNAIEITFYKHETEQRLRENAAFISAVTGAVPDIIYVCDLQTYSIIYINHSVAALLGYSEEEVFHLSPEKTVFDFLHPEDALRVKEYLASIASEHGSKVCEIEYRALRKDGQFIWLRSRDTVFKTSPEGESLQILGIARDITASRQAEIERRERQYYLETLNHIVQVALLSPDLYSLLQSLADRMGELIHANGCAITLWEECQSRFLPAVVSGVLQNADRLIPEDASALTLPAAVLETQSPVVISDIADTLYVGGQVAASYPARALLALPLIATNIKLGAVLIGFNHLHEFTLEEIAACTQAAQLVSLAIARTKLLEETRKYAFEMEVLESVSSAMRMAPNSATLLPAILQQVSRLLKAEGAMLIALDPSDGSAYVVCGFGRWVECTNWRFPPGQGINSRVIASGRTYVNNDAPNDPYTLIPDLFKPLIGIAAVPLVVQEYKIGSIMIGRKSPILDDDVRLLESISNMAASAIHRQRLHENLEEQFKILQTAQNRLIQTEKLAAIGSLIAGVAHELNNPLTSVILYAQMAQSREVQSDTAYELNKIVSEAQRAAEIVRGLLNFARQRPPERKPVQINQILKNSIELLAYELHSHNIQFTLELAPDLPVTLADMGQLQQVFINLITNAWQVMAENDAAPSAGVEKTSLGARFGKARSRGYLNVTSETGPSIFLGRSKSTQQVIRIVFQDSGPGIPSEYITQVFDPFFTTKGEKGTGLGLSICHGIISEHDGHIWAESPPGEGARFIIELPILAARENPLLSQKTKSGFQPLQSELHPAAESAASLKSENGLSDQALHTDTRILIIDDEVNMLDVLSRALRRRGYQVDTASNGRDGLALCQKQRYHLIMSDIRMPDVNGEEFYASLQQQSPDAAARVIFATGDTVSLSTRRFLDENHLTYLTKPFELSEFLAKIAAMAPHG